MRGSSTSHHSSSSPALVASPYIVRPSLGSTPFTPLRVVLDRTRHGHLSRRDASHRADARRPAVADRRFGLTDRELEIVSLLINGFANKQIVDTLPASELLTDRSPRRRFDK